MAPSSRTRSRCINIGLKIALFLGMAGAFVSAHAQTYPDRPIKLVVAFAAGGASDALARSVAQEASQKLGQSIVVENIAGAGGSVAARTVVRAPADGYTLILGSPGSMIINPLLQPNLPYDPQQFTPVSSLARISYALMIRQGLGAKNVSELVALSNSKPQGLTVGSAGTGSNTHLVAMAFMASTGAKVHHIPYKGTAPALNDLMAGNIDMLFDSVPVVIPQLQNSRVIVLAVTGAQRETAMQQVPTIAESGWPNFTANNWFGIFAPPKTPASVVEKLNQALNASLQDPRLRSRLQANGNRPAGGSPSELNKLVQDERASYQTLIKSSNISLE
ncbi:Bug family tripartite tricarboxylate transporter substrate binding protein [Ottowia thiooxydans]|uniref:Tripartite-type tricarboxylate transporter receptor subunit TctC n=1 Tax=Ottowia thiooxydans TaxID=219182 RepID=A0ABV2Q7H5_9BURK